MTSRAEGLPSEAVSEQLELVRAPGRRRTPAPVTPAAELPVARVVLEVGLAHLDREFDYTVLESQAVQALPGVRVRVRFAGQDVDGFVVARTSTSDHEGRLLPLRRVVSAEKVLTPQTLRLARAVADRYAGTLADVVRLAVPPRHATAEKGLEPLAEVPAVQTLHSDGPGVWARFPAGPAFLRRLRDGQAPRAVWTAPPRGAWIDGVLEAVAATVMSGRRVLVVVPDHRDLDRLEAGITARWGAQRHVRLEAEAGPAPRWIAFLRALRGMADVVIGTRAAAFAPVPALGLVVILDDGDDQYDEPRAPYPHSREVLRLRAEHDDAAFLAVSTSRSVDAAHLLACGWARPIDPEPTGRREGWAAVATADAEARNALPGSRLPDAAWRLVQAARQVGPVLVQVPRAGYVPALACQDCRAPARCPHCSGLLRVPGSREIPHCAWCARPVAGWQCPACGSGRLRAIRVGRERTAEELGRAFPGAKVVLARPGAQLAAVSGPQTLVVATPGVEPAAEEPGYAAAVLLDGDLMLARPDLRAAEEALHRWLAAAALVRGSAAGGRVVVCADPSAPAVAALVRVNPAWFADRELAERRELRLPPAVPTALITGPAEDVDAMLARLAADLPPGTDVMGPVPDESPVRPDEQSGPPVRALLRAPEEARAALARLLKADAAGRSSRRDAGRLRVRIDPYRVG